MRMSIVRLFVLSLILRVSVTLPTFSPTGEPSSCPTSSPTNRLIEEADPYHACQIPQYFSSDCDDHHIIIGTVCSIWFDCPEDKFPIAVPWTCQENGEWVGDALVPDCEADACPIMEGFQMYPTGGCDGRNEGGITFESLEECRLRCFNDDTCVSIEYSKPWDNHPEPNRCSISTSCTYDESRKLQHHHNCLYIKNLDVDTDERHSNNEGEITRHAHCALDGDYFRHFETTCDGTILAGTQCYFSYLCTERQWSNRVKQICQEDGTWTGRILEDGEIEQLDPNCYDHEEPSHVPTQKPFSSALVTEEYICSQVCPSSRTCHLCYDEEVAPQFCDANAPGDCTIERAKATTSYVEESKCISYGMTVEICHAAGGSFVPEIEACVSFDSSEETCVTEGGGHEVSMTMSTPMSPGQKACHLIYGYMCDINSGLKSVDRIVIVPEDEQCPSIQDWTTSCNILSDSNEVIPAPSSSGTGAISKSFMLLLLVMAQWI